MCHKSYAKMKKSTLIIIILLFSSQIFSQEIKDQILYYTYDDRAIYDKYIAYIADKPSLSTEDLIVETAKFFIGTPYVAHTLELEPEGLVVNLRELDCTTFMENVYALAATVRSRDLSFKNFCRNLKRIRYREELINDYSDRLHYTTDWIYENEKRGVVKNLTKSLGGKRWRPTLYIMSQNPQDYIQLANDQVLANKIGRMEQEFRYRKNWFIPLKKIDKNDNKFPQGGLLGFVTNMPGADVSHVAIIYKEAGMTKFIHASSRAKKVVLYEGMISDYVKSTGVNTGVVVAKYINY